MIILRQTLLALYGEISIEMHFGSVKNHPSKTGGMIMPLFEWFLSMSEILEISEHYQKAMLSEAVRTSKTSKFEEF